jgi:hypothetical protein
MGKRQVPTRLILIFSLLALAVSGCGVTKSVVNTFKPDPSGPKKRVMILPVVDLAGAGATQSARIEGDLFDLLGRVPHFAVYKAPPDMPLPSRSKSADLALITPPFLIQKARALGVNALVTSILNPVETTTLKTGVWPFRDLSKAYDVSMVVNVVDPTSGCLYLSHLESTRVVLPLDEVEGQKERVILEDVLSSALPRILERQSNAVSEGLMQEPWSGRILSSDDDTLIISGGQDVGVLPGQLFSVFEKSESVLCRSGRSLDVLGKKVGEIRTTSVMERQASAAPVKGGPFASGQVIRFER